MFTKDERRAQILDTLHSHPCLTCKEIAFFVKQVFGGDLMAPASVAGMLRPLVAEGKIGKDNSTGKMVYWIAGTSNEVKVR